MFESGPSKLSSIPTTGPGSISHSTSLPPLTFDLEQKLKTIGILAAQKDFMYHWGSYLWQVTAGHPSKQDYQNLANNIVKAFPSLGTSDGNSVSIMFVFFLMHFILVHIKKLFKISKYNYFDKYFANL